MVAGSNIKKNFFGMKFTPLRIITFYLPPSRCAVLEIGLKPVLFINKRDIANYRLISNLCSGSKIFEKLILKRILMCSKLNLNQIKYQA